MKLSHEEWQAELAAKLRAGDPEVHRALDVLSDMDREIIVRRLVQGESLSVVGRAVGRSPERIRQRQAKSERQVRKRFRINMFGASEHIARSPRTCARRDNDAVSPAGQTQPTVTSSNIGT